MRQIREVLRLRFASELPQRAIAKSLGLSQGTVSGYLSRARAAGVRWPLPADLDDELCEPHQLSIRPQMPVWARWPLR
jgi:predicted transcriptional regulator